MMDAQFEARKSDPNLTLIEGDKRLALWEVSPVGEQHSKTYLITLPNKERYRPDRRVAQTEYEQLKENLN